jgi:hypothetical protein
LPPIIVLPAATGAECGFVKPLLRRRFGREKESIVVNHCLPGGGCFLKSRQPVLTGRVQRLTAPSAA